jgi:Fe-S-cluster containining protein
MAIYENNALRFRCTGCGQCCSGGPDHHVFMDEREAESIRRHLGLTAPWFRRRYLRRTRQGDLVLNNGGGGRCVFLAADNACRIYAARPLQCRTYPFWPETVQSRAAWRREAARCEGIGHGGIVPLARIRAALAKHKKAEPGRG